MILRRINATFVAVSFLTKEAGVIIANASLIIDNRQKKGLI